MLECDSVAVLLPSQASFSETQTALDVGIKVSFALDKTHRMNITNKCSRVKRKNPSAPRRLVHENRVDEGSYLTALHPLNINLISKDSPTGWND